MQEAYVATLGGEGLEADLWRTLGIDHERAWLVDKSPRRIAKLMKNFRDFCIHQGNVDDFPGVLSAATGEGLDLFHLDACGTVEVFEDALVGILPLVLKSRAKMFVMTVSDARRSPSLDDPQDVEKRAHRFFGHHGWDVLRLNILSHHRRLTELERSRSDPYQAMTREVAALLVVCQAIMRLELGSEELVPVCLERFIYSSGMRMRTYVMRFELVPAGQSDDRRQRFASHFASLVQHAPLSWAERDEIVLVERSSERGKPPAPTSDKVASPIKDGSNMNARTQRGRKQRVQDDAGASDKKEVIMDKSVDLAALKAQLQIDAASLKPIAPHIAERILALLSTIDRLPPVIDAKAEVLRLFDHACGNVMKDFGLKPRLPAPASAVPVPTPPAPKKRGRPRKSSAPVVATATNLATADQLRLRLLRARSENKYDEVRAEIAESQKWPPDQVVVKAGALMAYASPKRCEAFVKRLIAATPAGDQHGQLEELSKLIPISLGTAYKHAGINMKPAPSR